MGSPTRRLAQKDLHVQYAKLRDRSAHVYAQYRALKRQMLAIRRVLETQEQP